MTETGLLVAQVVFLLLMFGFIASVVRSSARQLGRVQPPTLVTNDPVDPPRSAPAVAPPVPVVAPPAEPEPEVRQPTLEPFPSPLGEEPPGAPAAASPSEPLPAPVELPLVDPEAVPLPEEPPVEGADGEESPDAFDIIEASTQMAGSPIVDLTANITPRLVVENSPALEPGSDLELEGGLTIGRSGAADLSLADQYMSHMHARILRRGPYYFVEDLGSTNGTFLNDLRVDSSAQLKVHDTLRMGQTVLRYEE